MCPFASLSATTLPRAVELSLFGPDVPMYTVPSQYTGLPNTSALALFGWLVSTVSQRLAPFFSESASTRGLPTWATGTNTVGPPGAAGSIAAVPLICWPTSFDHRTFPLAASRAYTKPPLSPATRTPSATTGVPVKSPVDDLNVQAGCEIEPT